MQAKGVNNFVSDVDIAAEKEIIYHLQKAYPDHAFLAEESGLTGDENAEYRWLIDPLDGTTNFIRGIPHYAVSIACLHRGKLEHAVIVDPVRREEFTASRGRGAQLNGRRIRVSKLPGLDGALLGTGIPFKDHCDEKLGPYSKSIELLAWQCAGIRRAGAASLDLAYEAAGRLDAFWEIGLSPWDIAAGRLDAFWGWSLTLGYCRRSPAGAGGGGTGGRYRRVGQLPGIGQYRLRQPEVFQGRTADHQTPAGLRPLRP